MRQLDLGPTSHGWWRIIILRVSSAIFFLNFLIARQHAEHGERDIVSPFLSVCPSVRPMPVFCLNEGTYCHNFWHFSLNTRSPTRSHFPQHAQFMISAPWTHVNWTGVYNEKTAFFIGWHVYKSGDVWKCAVFASLKNYDVKKVSVE